MNASGKGQHQILEENWKTADHEEPIVVDYDPFLPAEKLPDDEEKIKRARIDELNAQIRRWFGYRARKIRKHRSKVGDLSKDPYTVLLAKLSRLVEPVVRVSWEEARKKEPEKYKTKKPKAGFRGIVARQVFAGLPQDEQVVVAAHATEAAKQARAEYMAAALNDRPSQDPAEINKRIEAVPDFIEPILRGLQEYTGLHSVLVLGGPMPKYGGALRTMHETIHNKARFSKNVLEFMKEYLAKMFTPNECSAVALLGTVDLAGAKYRISQEGSDINTGKKKADDKGKKKSDSDSDSQSDSDSSDDKSEDDRPQKKRKTGKENTTEGTSTLPRLPLHQNLPGTHEGKVPLQAEACKHAWHDTSEIDPHQRADFRREPTPDHPCAHDGEPTPVPAALPSSGSAPPSGVTTQPVVPRAGSAGTCMLLHACEIGLLAQLTLPWFQDAYTEMTREDLGPHFHAVLATWIRAEAASKFVQGPTNLPSKGRPKQVGTWIMLARGKRGCDTSVANPALYAVEWQQWWDSVIYRAGVDPKSK
ncbi:hypothetical protein DFH07DRAFT_950884 [Mycena maculata]|uniref:Uncharacterized protein n=1 Tax=Mycena maculata TaxID=230809 RepID=A0AAD7NWE8_9AGAR|nr:hypothetical protein DFH07DRAFT_950884 [Mycena maculata]